MCFKAEGLRPLKESEVCPVQDRKPAQILVTLAAGDSAEAWGKRCLNSMLHPQAIGFPHAAFANALDPLRLEQLFQRSWPCRSRDDAGLLEKLGCDANQLSGNALTAR